MLCREIRVENFRNIEAEKVAFSPGINILYGENAQGKTNLLEAVYFAAIGKSFRGQNHAEVIRFGAECGLVSLDYFGKGREQNLTVRLSPKRGRTVEKNGVRLERISDLLGEFRAVLFSPEHLSLIKEGPAERRRFLDIAVSGLYPVYLRSLQRYDRILKQRNAVLKEERGQESTALAEIYAKGLATEGAEISAYRYRYLQKLDGYVKECFREMTGDGESPTLEYRGVCKTDIDAYGDKEKVKEILYSRLTENTEREFAAGATLYGIHKDDIEVTLNGRSARDFSSQGQQRSLALAMKIGEGEICCEECGEYPVLLLDDVLSELDGRRREYLLCKIREKQVILTSCESDPILNGEKIYVKNGQYKREEI